MVADLLDDPPPSSSQMQRGLLGGSNVTNDATTRGNASVKTWSTPSLPLSTSPSNAGNRVLSPLEMLLRSCHLLVNPEGLTKGQGRPLLEFEGQRPSEAEMNRMSPEAQKTLAFFFGSSPDPIDQGLLNEVTVMSEAEVRELLSHALGEQADLPLPSLLHPLVGSTDEDDARGLESGGGGGLRISLALATHSVLFGRDGGERGLPSSLVSRPDVRTRDESMAKRIRSIRDYLGWILIRSFEQRRREIKASALSSVALREGVRGSSKVEGEIDSWLFECEKDLMLQWIDVCWSCFLEEVDKVKKATFLRAGAHSEPLTEFRLEANRTFLSTLDAYRESVVEAIMAHRPEINYEFHRF